MKIWKWKIEISDKAKKIVLLTVAGIFLVIQCIRPDRNVGEMYGSNDITKTVEVPEKVMVILEKACMDCHSNRTQYPWYYSIEPLGWWLAHHVDEGKDELNFSEFNTYKLKRKLHKFEEIVEMVNEGEMPLASYALIHGKACLTGDEKKVLVDWALAARTNLDTVKVVPQSK